VIGRHIVPLLAPGMCAGVALAADPPARQLGEAQLVGLAPLRGFSPRLVLFARIDNIFDRRYFVSGQPGANAFGTPGCLIDFRGRETPILSVAPGAPRTRLPGLRYAFGPAGATPPR
jgi:hypothetical protein